MSFARQRISRETDSRCSVASEGTATATGSDPDTDGEDLDVLLLDHRRWSIVNCAVDTKQETVDREETSAVPAYKTVLIGKPKRSDRYSVLDRSADLTSVA